MLFGRASELAIRAVVHLALQPPGKLTPVHEIAQGTGLPGPYLAKLMRRLIDARLVRAFRGPGGGLQLGRSPEAVSLWSVVRAMEGPLQPQWCVLGLRLCSPEKPCPMHPRWSALCEETQRLLEETTLALLVQGLRENLELGPESWVRVPSPGTRRPPAELEKSKGEEDGR